MVVSLISDLTSFSTDVEDVADYVALVALTAIPFAFLAGLLRHRVERSHAVRTLVTRLSEEPERRPPLRDALAEALADPGLELAYWIPEREHYVDTEGRAVALPAPGGDTAWTPVDNQGQRVAAIVHDAALADDAMVRAAGSAAALALENERLDADLRCNLEELRASRARLVEAGLAERRRLERDLHDGAQQRLVALALALRMAGGKLREDPDAAEKLLESARAELDLALEELRELARGIHPAVLSDRGLEPALKALASKAPVPVDLTATPEGELPDAVESAAYFVVAEALTNMAKYASASRATVGVSRENGRVIVEVADDGVGGADPSRGSGLRGLADRVSALDGRLELDSSPGSGTVLRARIPCA